MIHQKEFGFAKESGGRWAEFAYGLLVEMAEKNPRLSGDEFIKALQQINRVPRDKRSTGGIFRKAINRKVIIDDGTQVHSERRHLTKVTHWRSLIFKGA